MTIDEHLVGDRGYTFHDEAKQTLRVPHSSWSFLNKTSFKHVIGL